MIQAGEGPCSVDIFEAVRGFPDSGELSLLAADRDRTLAIVGPTADTARTRRRPCLWHAIEMPGRAAQQSARLPERRATFWNPLSITYLRARGRR